MPGIPAVRMCCQTYETLEGEEEEATDDDPLMLVLRLHLQPNDPPSISGDRIMELLRDSGVSLQPNKLIRGPRGVAATRATSLRPRDPLPPAQIARHGARVIACARRDKRLG
jgi:hypothetical protein